MSEFLVSFFYTTISLAIIMPIFILAEGKRRKKYIRILEEKNKQLLETIQDADEMLDELNILSDYIASLLEQKKDGIIKQEDTNIHAVEAEKEVNERTGNIENKTIDRSDISTSADKYTLGFTQEKQLHKEVFELLEKGMNCDEIARKLNRGKGEVQLIIDMKKYY